VLHVANMDQSPTAVRNLTLDVTFHHADGSVSHRGVDWYWFTTGVSRTVKAGLASLQENWRSGTRPTEAVMADIRRVPRLRSLSFAAPLPATGLASMPSSRPGWRRSRSPLRTT